MTTPNEKCDWTAGLWHDISQLGRGKRWRKRESRLGVCKAGTDKATHKL